MIQRIGSLIGGGHGPAILGARCLGGLALVALLLSSLAPAAAQDIRAQVQRLQQELKTLQQRVYGGSAGATSAATGSAGAGDLSRPLAARLELRLGELETQMRSLTGQVEQVGYRIDQVSRRLEQVAADLNARVQRLEQQPVAQLGGYTDETQGFGAQATAGQVATGQIGAGQVGAGQAATGQAAGQPAVATMTSAGGQQLAPGEAGPQVLGSVSATNLETLRQQAAQQGGSQAAAPPAPTTLGAATQAATQAGSTQTAAAAGTAGTGFATPKAQYDNAFTLLSQANYPAAEAALSAFIDAHPQDPLAGNAMYWLGETHYVRGQYREAAVTFAEGYQSYPNSAKAPDNLLKLGKSLSALGQTQDACGTLAELTRRYPKAPSNVLQQAQREQQKLSCP